MSRVLPSLLIFFALVPALRATDSDWPQFRGPNRDGISASTDLLTTWPESGPPEVWRQPIGPSFAGIVVANGRAFTMESTAEGEFAISFRTVDGSEIWRSRIGERFQNNFGDGSRSTPTLDGDRLYILTALGELAALSAADGTVHFKLDLKTAFGSEQPNHGFSTSPLVLDERLILEAGGTEGRSIVALDKTTGKVLWHHEHSAATYSSPIAIELGGEQQLVFVNQEKVLGLTPEGKPLWSHSFAAGQGVKPAMPIFLEPDLIFVSASYDIGAMAVRVTSQEGEAMVAEEVWKSRVMRNHFNSSVALGKYIYGFDNATLKCIDGTTGEQQWAQRGRLGKGSLIYAAGHLVVLSETGQLVLVKADSEAYREVAKASVLSGRCWTSPTLADGRLYLRNRDERICLDLRASAPTTAAPIQEGGR